MTGLYASSIFSLGSFTGICGDRSGGGQLRVHGVARDADFPRDLGDGLAAFAQLAYRIGLRHADHTFLTSLVDFSRRKPS